MRQEPSRPMRLLERISLPFHSTWHCLQCQRGCTVCTHINSFLNLARARNCFGKSNLDRKCLLRETENVCSTRKEIVCVSLKGRRTQWTAGRTTIKRRGNKSTPRLALFTLNSYSVRHNTYACFFCVFF